MHRAGPEVIKVEFILKLKIKCNDWLRVRTQPIIALYFEFEIVLKFNNLGAWNSTEQLHRKANILRKWISEIREF